MLHYQRKELAGRDGAMTVILLHVSHKEPRCCQGAVSA